MGARKGRALLLVLTIFVLSAATELYPADKTSVEPSRDSIIRIVTQIQRADYEGDRATLKRLHDELTAIPEDNRLASRVLYWRGFALWRRAINGFNESPTPTDLEEDLTQAVTDFKDGIARDQLGASFKQYLLNSVKVYGNTRFDLPSETFSEVMAGVKYFPIADLVMTGEWYQSYPTFDSTSIYSVFAVSRYQEGVLRADYTINDKISANIGYSRQDYEGGDADVVEVGCRIRPIEHLNVTLNYDHRNGYGGRLNGGIAEVAYEATKQLEIAGGLHHDVYERDRLTGDETARKYWLGGKYKIKDNMSASVRVEDNVNARYKEDYSGRLAFNFDF